MRILLLLVLVFIGGTKAVAASLDPTTEACFRQAGTYHGIDPSWLKAIAKVESNFTPKAIGKRNKNGTFDVGMMQINSGWFDTLAKYGIKPGHLTEPCTNIFVGAWILSKNMRMYGKTWQAIGAYNTGNPRKLQQRSAQYATLVRKAWETLNAPTAQRIAALTHEGGVRYE